VVWREAIDMKITEQADYTQRELEQKNAEISRLNENLSEAHRPGRGGESSQERISLAHEP